MRIDITITHDQRLWPRRRAVVYLAFKYAACLGVLASVLLITFYQRLGVHTGVMSIVAAVFLWDTCRSRDELADALGRADQGRLLLGPPGWRWLWLAASVAYVVCVPAWLFLAH